MDSQLNDRVSMVTTQLKEERLHDLNKGRKQTDFLLAPAKEPAPDAPLWRIKLEPLTSPNAPLGLDIHDEIILGRNSDSPALISLEDYDAVELGLSRHHAKLHPGDTALYITDLDSTNGTWRNGRSIGVNTPYSLRNGDLLRLGKLEMVVHIIKSPAMESAPDEQPAMWPIVQDVLSNLAMDDVIKQALKYTCAIPTVEHASIWLVEEQTGDLLLEAELSTSDEDMRRMHLSIKDSRVAQVIETGRPLLLNRSPEGPQLKVNTGYLADAVAYIPLHLSKVTFGVLCATHRHRGQLFSPADETSLTSIADITAIAIQNARLYESTEKALTRRAKMVTALNYILAYNVKRELNAALGYGGMMQIIGDMDDDTLDSLHQMMEAASGVAAVIERLIEVTGLYSNVTLKRVQTDLIQVVEAVINHMQEQAEARQISLNFEVTGTAYPIYGDPVYLYRSVASLLDNAIKFSPEGGNVAVMLDFWPEELHLSVRDDGPGIDETDLPHLFDRYFHGGSDGKSHNGLGLGLELVSATVEGHRGTVTAKNKAGHGAQFTVTLPGALRVS
jgi:signal transduction histidine kinase